MKAVHIITFSVLVLIIIFLLLGKESYKLIPNTAGGVVGGYSCKPGPGVINASTCQVTTKAVAEKLCDSLPDCVGYASSKPTRFYTPKIPYYKLTGGNGILRLTPTDFFDFYKKVPKKSENDVQD